MITKMGQPDIYAGFVGGAAMLDERDRNAANKIGSTREPSLLGAIAAEIDNLTGHAGILRDRTEGLRRRVLCDIPPSPEVAGRDAQQERGPQVSFIDIGEALQRLRAVMSDIDAHTAALAKIG